MLFCGGEIGRFANIHGVTFLASVVMAFKSPSVIHAWPSV